MGSQDKVARSTLGLRSLFDMESRRLAAARRLVPHLADLLQGDLTLQLWNGERFPLGPNARDDICIIVRSPAAVRRLILKPKLETFFRLFAEAELDVIGGDPMAATRRFDHERSLRLGRSFDKKLALSCAWPFLFSGPGRADARNEKARLDFHKGGDDQDLVQFHYDLSNDFYALFLDPEMVYSCGYFATPDTSLADAQIAKLDRVCRKLQLKPGDRLLDMGCGWGGLICHAARRYGALSHGVTLSKAQYEFGAAKIAQLGLGDRVTLELRDCRSIEAAQSYDKIAQIEMFEHIGLDNHDQHFEHVHRLLRPRGLYLHHSITRLATRDLAKFRKPTRYQKVVGKFIFPGGELDYLGRTAANLERHGFEIHDVEGMREHFLLTFERWMERLYAKREAAYAEIGSARTRMWLLYFVLGRAFERTQLGIFQTLASKRAVGASGLPLGRVS